MRSGLVRSVGRKTLFSPKQCYINGDVDPDALPNVPGRMEAQKEERAQRVTTLSSLLFSPIKV